jgi:predicted kinase
MKTLREIIDQGADAECLREVLSGGDAPDCFERYVAFDCGDGSLLDRTLSAWRALCQHPVPSPQGQGPACRPWWPGARALRAAVLFMHAGLPRVADREGCAPGRMPAHGRTSAAIARRTMRGLGVDFCAREHAVALVRAQRRPGNLERGQSPDETVLRLSCRLDLRLLYRMERVEMAAAGSRRGQKDLESFRERAERLGVFGRPAAPPIDAEYLRGLGYEDERSLHRALNACRYFQLVADMQEPGWHRERMRQEAEGRPGGDGPDRGRLHLLIGPAATGKSTWAEEHLGHTTIVSTDEMRRELTGDPEDQSQNYLVFQRCADRLRELLRQGRQATFDATNICEKNRELPVQAARWAGAEIVSYLLDVPRDEALLRNRERQRQVPEEVVRRHYHHLTPPLLYEADRHRVVHLDGSTDIYWPGGRA